MPRFNSLLDVQLISKDEFRIRLGEDTRTGTLYYLGIDPQSAEHDSSPAEGLSRLFASWLEQLLRSRDRQGLCYLPFDFADESTQWLACELSDNMIHAIFGWADVEGWAISPSDISPHATSLPDFTPNEPAFVQSFYLPRLLSDLRRTVGTLARQANDAPDRTSQPPAP